MDQVNDTRNQVTSGAKTAKRGMSREELRAFHAKRLAGLQPLARDEYEAARLLGCSTKTLQAARVYRRGGFADLPWISQGRNIRYLQTDIDAWLLRHRIDPEARTKAA